MCLLRSRVLCCLVVAEFMQLYFFSSNSCLAVFSASSSVATMAACAFSMASYYSAHPSASGTRSQAMPKAAKKAPLLLMTSNNTFAISLGLSMTFLFLWLRDLFLRPFPRLR
eukprot:7095542-Pyramimonas_sp.AAC.1